MEVRGLLDAGTARGNGVTRAIFAACAPRTVPSC